MVDVKQLKELGWSDDLIHQIESVAGKIQKSAITPVDIDVPQFKNVATSANAVYFETPELDAGNNLKLSD